jgi:hypothetical protein
MESLHSNINKTQAIQENKMPFDLLIVINSSVQEKWIILNSRKINWKEEINLSVQHP